MPADLNPEEIRARMAQTLRYEQLRSLYHLVMGEVIRLRLAYKDAPEFTVTEHHDTFTVSLVMDGRPDTLVLGLGSERADDQAAVREWIEQRVDTSRLTRSRHPRHAHSYWR